MMTPPQAFTTWRCSHLPAGNSGVRRSMLELPNERKEVRAWRIQQSFDFGGVPHLQASGSLEVWQKQSLCTLRVYTSSDRRRVRGAGCWPGALTERPVQPAGTHKPTPIHVSFVLEMPSSSVRNCEGKQRERKTPLRGVLGVNPKP